MLSTLFSASESAFLGINKLRLHYLREQGDRRARRVGKLLDHKEQLLNTLLVANELVNVALSVILTSIALELFGPAGLSLSTLVATVLLLLFGEITPKIITTRIPEESSFAVSGIVMIVWYLLKPFVLFFTAISRFILHLRGISTKMQAVSFTEEEIKTFIDVGGEQGILERGEKNMMNRVFKFTDLEAVDIMVPRLKIVPIKPDMRYRDILELSERTRLKRFPVIREDIDDIIGVLYIKDLLFYTGSIQDFRVEKIMREPLFIPGSTKMSAIQSLLHEKKQTFAVVIDEYSGTDGILTSEDIAHEIFGALSDDYEQSGRATGAEIAAGSGDSDLSDFMLDGSARLEDVSEALHCKLESLGNETIAGFICDKLAHIPVPGEYVKANGYLFYVVRMDGRRVSQVHCLRAADEEES
ncbi:MAG: hemolysin family protein [Treponema sp.]|nr:hemolysin family protein [Treponema sp.]